MVVDDILNWTLAGNLSWVEFYWCLVALVGLVVGGANVWDATRELRRMKQADMNGIGESVAITSQKGDLLRILEMLCAMLIGLFGAFAPPSPLAPISAFYWWYRLMLVVALLVIEHAIIANILLIRYNRIKVLSLYDQKFREGGRK